MSIFTYRFLQPDEYSKVDPIFQHFDWNLPSPQLGTIAVAEDPDGSIKALGTIQLVAHCEPWACLDPHVNLLQMREMIEELVKSNPLLGPGYIIIAATEDAERMALANGMTKVEGVIYRKEMA